MHPADTKFLGQESASTSFAANHHTLFPLNASTSSSTIRPLEHTETGFLSSFAPSFVFDPSQMHRNPFRSPPSGSTSPLLPPFTNAIHQYAGPSIPRRYYRQRAVSLLIGLVTAVTIFLLARSISWALSGDVDEGLLANMSPLKGTVSLRVEISTPPPQVPNPNLPPLYPEFFAYEESLFQHHAPLSLTTNKKFIHFANHLHMMGFNNNLEEYILNAHLATLVNRSFIFNEYIWNSNFRTEPFSDFNGKKIPSRIPESAILGGWLGGSVRHDPTSSNARSDWDITPVSRPFYEKACSSEETVYINADQVMDTQLSSLVDMAQYPELVGKRVRDADGIHLVQGWVARLMKDDVKEARCVEVAKDTGHAFDYMLFGDHTLLTIWDSLIQSPVLKEWSFSPLIYEAFRRNIVEHNILGPTAKNVVAAETSKWTSHSSVRLVVDGVAYDEYGFPVYPKGYAYPPIYAPPRTDDSRKTENTTFPFEQKNLDVYPYPKTPDSSRTGAQQIGGTLPIIALHLRRGDFDGHCLNLAAWGSSFVGFASFDEFEERDKFISPQVDGSVEVGKKGQGTASTRGSVQIAVSRSGVTSNSSYIGHTFTQHDAARVKTMDERKEIYVRHCYPNTEQIVSRVKEVVEDWVGRRWVEWVEGWEKRRASVAVAGIGEDEEWAYDEALVVWKNEILSALKSVYIMTNGNRKWAGEVRNALMGLTKGSAVSSGLSQWDFHFQADVDVENEVGLKTMKKRSLEWAVDEWPWDAYYANGEGERKIPILIATARDIQLKPEEKYVGQAVDMYFGQRAELFIGNGFSSMTANVAMLRKKDGLGAFQTRFW